MFLALDARCGGIAPLLAPLLAATAVNGQISNQTTLGPTATGASGIAFANPSGYSTQSYNESAVSTNLPNNDFSDERLNLLWAQVGTKFCLFTSTYPLTLVSRSVLSRPDQSPPQ